MFGKLHEHRASFRTTGSRFARTGWRDLPLVHRCSNDSSGSAVPAIKVLAMDELFALHTDHVFLRREALAHGYDDRDLRTAMRDDLINRVRHGAYVPSSVWRPADDLERHRLRSHAVLRSHGSPLALSHTSAAIEHGLRLHRPDLSKVHVLCLDEPLARSTPDII